MAETQGSSRRSLDTGSTGCSSSVTVISLDGFLEAKGKEDEAQMEAKRALLTSKELKKSQCKGGAVKVLMRKRQQAFFDKMYKMYIATGYNGTYAPWGVKRTDRMSSDELEAEWDETRKAVILPTDWNEWFDSCLKELIEGTSTKRDAVLIRYVDFKENEMWVLCCSPSLFLFLFEHKEASSARHLIEDEGDSKLLLTLRKIFLQVDSSEARQNDAIDYRVIIILILSFLCGYFKKAIFQVHSLFFPILIPIATNRSVDGDEEAGENPPVEESLELRCSVISSSPPITKQITN